MRRTAVGFLLALLALPAAARSDDKFEAMLKRIDPSERLEQVCEYAALTTIGKDKNPLHPDRVVVDTLSSPKVDGDSMSGTGAALRSRGKWYRFEFACKATPDRLKVLSFRYRIGDEIPEAKWDELGLWR